MKIPKSRSIGAIGDGQGISTSKGCVDEESSLPK